ncbi:MAG: sirohydrochlorin cobaltochelatase [Lachnospiraceae bacterium]|nr:sirohydrochlorin cobaltochelatase [Lachnospiraceae bacterium]
MKKRLMLLLATILSVCCIGGCGNAETQQESKDKAILVVSFGTSYNDSREITIGAIESAIAAEFAEYDVRRAFTSQIIIDILEDRDKLEIDNVVEALDRAVEDGIKELVVQPTHLMNGYEYDDLTKELSGYVDKFDKIILAEPLLMSDADFDAVVKAITEKTASYDDGETAICFMGHGTEAASNGVYAKLQEKLTESGYENYYVGTVEAAPTLDDVSAALKAKGTYKKVVLEPLMVVAGDHANNDMAGAEEDSWKSILEKEGYQVECVLEGLGQIPAIQDIYVAHTQAAISTGTVFTGITEESTENAGELKDGTYAIEVESSSSMFKIVKAELTVANGEMNAVITMSGTGYTKLYMGTAEKAAAAQEADCITFVEDADGAYTFTLPVEALDQPIDCAAFSQKKEEWYDRQLTFMASTISDGTAVEESTVATEEEAPTEVKVEDGIYSVEVTLGGGSGKTTITSPTTITVSGDSVIARIEWSSPNYDYMLVGEEKYLPVNTEGNSAFEIPVSAFDAEMPVIGNTVAMSKPREIEYTLTFHSNTMKAVE